jgi:uncharacterized membrane protein
VVVRLEPGRARTPRPAGAPAPEAPPGQRRRLWPAVVTGMVVADAALFAGLSIARHRAFSSGRFDLGNMVQALWSTAHGHFLETTDVSGVQFNRLGAHVDLLLVLLTPLYWLWSSPEMLLVVQAIGVAVGAFPAFWLGRRWLGDDRLAAAAAGIYLLYPPLQYATLFDFHPVTLAAPLLLFCIWAAEEGRWWTLGVCAALAALSQEQVGLALVVLAVWLAARHPERRQAALALGAGALAWVIVCFTIIIPSFAISGLNPHARRYDSLGSGPVDALTHPWRVLTTLTTVDRLGYLLALLLPLLFLPLLAPLLAACALPQLAINLYASSGPAQEIDFHYTAVLVPFLVASAILGLARLRERAPAGALGRLVRRPRATAGALVAAMLVAGVALGPLWWWARVPLTAGPSPHNRYTVDAGVNALREAVALVPPGAVVSATNEAGAHLSERRRILLFPRLGGPPSLGGASWVVISTAAADRAAAEGRKTLWADRIPSAVAALEASGHWRRVFDRDGVRVYRRVGPAATLTPA